MNDRQNAFTAFPKLNSGLFRIPLETSSHRHRLGAQAVCPQPTEADVVRLKLTLLARRHGQGAHGLSAGPSKLML
jgi:hypothetical protein